MGYMMRLAIRRALSTQFHTVESLRTIIMSIPDTSMVALSLAIASSASWPSRLVTSYDTLRIKSVLCERVQNNPH